MALHGPTFFKRLSSAIVFSALVMTGLLWHSLAFFALLVVIQILCLRDYFRLSGFILLDKQLGFSHKLWVQVLSLLPLTTAAFPLFGIEKKMQWSCLAAILPILLLLLYLAKNGTLVKMISGVSGVIYIVLPLVFFVELKNIHTALPVALILMIWMNDTMAYLVGSFIGKTKMTKISPKKTWEGTIGGIVLTIAGSAIWGNYSPWFQMVDWVIMGACVGVGGTLGDLLESKLKREAGVKDSGHLMPGHGGALDRFDSLLLATPLVAAYFLFFFGT